MNKEELNIDFELIRKKAKSELNQNEEAQLQAWLKQDERHQHYLEKAIHYLKEGKVKDARTINTKGAWINTEKRIKPQQKTNTRLWLSIASSVAAVLIIFFSVYMMSDFNESSNTLADKMVHIEPGSKRAELVLSDGSIVKLGEGAEQLKEQDGTLINTDSSTVSYQYANGKLADNLYNEVRVRHGEEFQLQLADGTKVWINSMSSIKFPVHFTAETREVEISGEVYFEVKHDVHKPFIVHTPVHDVRVLGTSFNVSCYSDDEYVHTTLVEGSVEINNVIGGSKSTVLTPDKQYTFNKTSLVSEVKTVDTDNYTAWTMGYFQFEEQALGDIFAKLQRWYKIDVFFTNNTAKQELFTGRLPRFENIDTLLALIEQVSDVEFETNENAIIVK